MLEVSPRYRKPPALLFRLGHDNEICIPMSPAHTCLRPLSEHFLFFFLKKKKQFLKKKSFLNVEHFTHQK